jgi:ABC-type phosphate transport system substrate-binding protein
MNHLRINKLALIALLTWSTACSRKPQILISGSETMRGVIAKVAEAFNDSQKKYEVLVTGGGSKTGIDDLTHSRVDMAMTSNSISETHLAALADISKFEKADIGYDGIAIVVHPSTCCNTPRFFQARSPTGRSSAERI